MIADFYWGVPPKDLCETTSFQMNGNKKRKMSEIVNNNQKNYQIYDPLIYTFGKEVHFSAGIDKLTIEIIIKHISAIIHAFAKDYESRDEELEITLVLDSPGGSVLSVLKYVDFIRLTKIKHPTIKFKSVISGIAASACTIMACVADTRLMTTNATAMIHDLSGGNNGTYTQMMSQVEFIKHLNDSLVNIYVKNCKKTKEELVELLKTNKWFNANQYLEYGFIDAIV